MKRIITINREYGSGGYDIGKKLAERIGYEFYDKKIIKHVAEETGFDPKYVEANIEHTPASGFQVLLFQQRKDTFMDGMSTREFLLSKQREVIRRFAEEGPSVFIGRCADYALRNRTDVFNVFITAPAEFRLNRIATEASYGVSDRTPEERLKDKDKRRAENYRDRTGKIWGDCRNYHLCLDSSVFGIDRCVEIIEELIR